MMKSSTEFTADIVLKIEEALKQAVPLPTIHEIHRLVRGAMIEAWETGNGYDHGMPYTEF